MPQAREYVFGYGSLTEARDGVPATLSGWRRAWGVAMDNRRDLPGYKVYLDPDGTRPPVHVCFLDIEPAAAGSAVDGLCVPVDAGRLRELDARERNYERLEISAELRGGPPRATVWTYVGSPAGRARFAAGRSAGDAVIGRGYLESVRAGLRALGAAALVEAARSLDPGEIPVVELVRRELPAPEGAG